VQDALPLRRILDPRPSAETAAYPYRESVNIPLDELAQRRNELPRKGRTLQVAASEELYREAQRVLLSLGINGEAPTALDWRVGPRPRGRLWSPSEFLLREAPLIKQETAIDLGCGSGRDAVWLAANGWKVMAIDHLSDAIDMARDLERRYLAQPSINWRPEDYLASKPQAFDLIFCSFSFRKPLTNKLIDFAHEGTVALIETFTLEHRRTFNKPKEEAVLAIEELQGLEKWTIEHVEQGWHYERHTIRARLRCTMS